MIIKATKTDHYITLDIDYQGANDAQKYDKTFIPDMDMPAGMRLSITKTGPFTRRFEIVKVEETTALPAAPAAPKPLAIPEVLTQLKKDDDLNLEAIAVENGVKVDAKWKAQAWPKRIADVAKVMNDKKQPA